MKVYKKLLALFFFISITSLIFSQEKNILKQSYSLSEENTPIYQVILKLTQKTGYDFSYNSDIIDDEKKISLALKDYRLDKIIDTLFQDTSLTYNVVKNHIVIHRKNEQLKPSNLLKKERKPITLEGKVLKNKNKEPLPFATISLKNHPVGTITNEQGKFIFKIDPLFASDTLIVSYLGYGNKSFPIKNIQSIKPTILMEEKRYSIQEVIVRTRDPYIILKKAVERIQDNYFTQNPILLTSFYRETIKKEEQFTSVSEALLKIYKPNNRIFQSSQFKVLKSRKTIDYSKKDSVMLKLKAGLDAILYLDIVDERLSFLHPLNREIYSYSLEDISYFNKKDVYVISFKPDGESNMPLYTGKIYIELESLAIIGAEFHLNKDNLRKVSESLIIKKKWDIKAKPKSTSYYVSYKKSKGKYHLNHIRGDLTFRIRRKGELFGEDFHVSFEMVTNNIKSENISKFQSKETAKPHKIFIEQIGKYDPEFWGDYNYIIPNEPIQKTIKKLNSRIKMLE
jgi:hypothetical protein